MIKVTVDADKYITDIHSLIKAFFPDEDVLVKTPEGFALDAAKRAALKNPPPEPEISLEGNISCSELPVNLSDRKETKNRLKRALYTTLSDYTGRTLPWGSLTGVRPVKIPLTLINEGKTKDEACAFMKSEYFVSDEKAALAVAVAENEKAILSSFEHGGACSLYIGIPFCPSTCLYCSFTSFPIALWQDRVGDYLSALEAELAATAELMHSGGKALSTIYIGGGTPTSLSSKELERLLVFVEKTFDTGSALEYTLEAGRPDSITKEKLDVMREHGVSRISVNPQTMNDKTLALIGRHHTSAQTVEAYELARGAGFDNINMDLILGLPGETYEDVCRTMNIISRLAPDDVTLHSLAVKRGSRLHKELFEQRHAKSSPSPRKSDLSAARDESSENRQSFENSDAVMSMTSRVCRDMGLTPYYLYRQKNMAGNLENVGWSRPGKAGIYNIITMEECQSVLACGAGAISKLVLPGGKIIRSQNFKDPALYIEKPDIAIERKRSLASGLASHE